MRNNSKEPIDQERFRHLPLLVPISVIREFTGLSVSRIQTMRDDEGKPVFGYFQETESSYKKYYKVDLAKFCRLEM